MPFVLFFTFKWVIILFWILEIFTATRLPLNKDFSFFRFLRNAWIGIQDIFVRECEKSPLSFVTLSLEQIGFATTEILPKVVFVFLQTVYPNR